MIGLNCQSSSESAAKKLFSRGEGSYWLEAAAGAITYAYPETWCLLESLSGVKGLPSGWVQRDLTIYYVCPSQGGVVLCRWWWRRRKREVGRKILSEIKWIDIINDKIWSWWHHSLLIRAKILYAHYFCSICLCLVDFLCAQVFCEIRNQRTQVNYRGMHLVIHIIYYTNHIVVLRVFTLDYIGCIGHII